MAVWHGILGAGSLATALFAAGGRDFDEQTAPPSAIVIAPAPGPATGHSLHRARDGLFYVTARVNGVPVRFVVDTGATRTVFTKRDANAAGLTIDHRRGPGRVETASGAASMGWTHVETVAIGGRTVHGLDAIIPNGGVRTSLLGQDILSRLDRITVEKDRMTLN
jgi:aspartyl protease family protein